MDVLDIVPQSNFKRSIKRNKPTAVISIRDPFDRRGFGHSGKTSRPPFIFGLLTIPKLALVFEDVVHDIDQHAPRRHHIQQIIDFARSNKDASLVVHCWAGQCRSSAAAAICQIANGRDPKETFEDLSERFPQIHPNPLMIDHAQEILGGTIKEEYEKMRPLWIWRFEQINGIFH